MQWRQWAGENEGKRDGGNKDKTFKCNNDTTSEEVVVPIQEDKKTTIITYESKSKREEKNKVSTNKFGTFAT